MECCGETRNGNERVVKVEFRGCRDASIMTGHRLDNLGVPGLAEGVAEPLKTLVETVTGSSAGGLDVL